VIELAIKKMVIKQKQKNALETQKRFLAETDALTFNVPRVILRILEIILKNY